MIKRKQIGSDMEKKILIGLIVSSQYIQAVNKSFRYDYLKTRYARIVAKWAFDYFEKYKKAPDKTIKDIFQIEKDALKKSEAQLIKKFLSLISSEYDRDNFNVDYLIDKSNSYFRERANELLFRRGKKLLDAGRVEDAQQLLEGHKQVSLETTDRFNPFDVKEIRSRDIENEQAQLFRFPGALGQMIGWFERDWLVSFTAPEKRGKSWWLEETAFTALENGCKVLLISLEMGKKAIKSRIYKRLTGLHDNDIEGKDIKIPIIDCKKNQNGSCRNRHRKNKRPLLSKKGEKPEYDSKSNYEPCTYCRGKGRKFEGAYWFEAVENKGGLINKKIEKKAKAIKMLYGDLLRVKIFPAYSANSQDIVHELNDLEYSEGFIPDVVVIDYIDILAPEGNLEGRDNIDITWKMFKQIASVRHCVVVTADQSNKRTYESAIKLGDTSEDKRKNAHLDIKIGINQDEHEKMAEVMALSVIAHRHKEFYPSVYVATLQKLGLGQPLLDSEWIKRKGKKTK